MAVAEQEDYMEKYMKTAEGTPDLIVHGVLLFFKSTFDNETLDELKQGLSYLPEYTLEEAKKFLDEKEVPSEITRQILTLLNKKFKEAIEKKKLTSKKLEFIRNVKKKH
ncbi:MAG: hypothetical protein GF308_15735 [Candidatus Heimdallarchaeota archaeon]|nr:hypothetical protein [Candidatus Heimdallarchaeota archaeon]